MMQQKKKNKKAIKPVKKPFLRGNAVDKGTFRTAVMFFFGLIGMVLINVLLGSIVMWDIPWLNIVFSCALLLVVYSVFYQNGANKGTAAVNQGEIMWQRQQDGKTVAAEDKALCFHPLKGFIGALLGSLPALICGIMLAVVAQKQFTGLGALPTWINTLQRQTEMADALAIYQTSGVLSMEDTLRMIVRMLILPFVNMVGAENRDGLLILERISALILLLPAVSYGLGYLRGVDVRTRVHTEIAMGKRKHARKEKKRRQARIEKGPEQLN